jgi:hypothetical protein
VGQGEGEKEVCLALSAQDVSVERFGASEPVGLSRRSIEAKRDLEAKTDFHPDLDIHGLPVLALRDRSATARPLRRLSRPDQIRDHEPREYRGEQLAILAIRCVATVDGLRAFSCRTISEHWVTRSRQDRSDLVGIACHPLSTGSSRCPLRRNPGGGWARLPLSPTVWRTMLALASSLWTKSGWTTPG